ncbi:MAG: DJ-1/PfpI family protein [Cyclobacteriaceae bacterium]
MSSPSRLSLAVLLFDDFETLDVFGPVEVFGRLKEEYAIHFYSLSGGEIRNSHGVAMNTEPLAVLTGPHIFLIPGGYGTRPAVFNAALIDEIRRVSVQSEYVFTVCTGTSLLARTGLLDGRKATSNKRAFDWVVTNGPAVQWIRQARWTVDGKYYTSSGVSAGIDMCLGFLSDRRGQAFAREVAWQIEFDWTEDKDTDHFYVK